MSDLLYFTKIIAVFCRYIFQSSVLFYESLQIMRKYLLLLLVLVTGFFSLDAQIKMGGEIGIHSANVIESNSIPGWDTATKPFYSSRTAIHLGVKMEIPLSRRFFFQPAINYTSKGRQYTKNNSSNPADSTGLDTVYVKNSLNIGYIEIPFYLTYKIPLSANHLNNFFIGAGPYFSFIYDGSFTNQLLTQQDTINNFSTETDKLQVGNAVGKYKTYDIGFNAKAGLEFNSVTISAFMSRGLTNFYTASYPGTFHHQVMGVSLGIWFGKVNVPASAPRPPRASKPVVKDSDNDGIPDDQDMCPFQPGVARYHGCPVPDTDGDGIDDEHDSCKTVPGLARYHGCPIPDRDHDGINDEEDKCPDVPGVPENNGCPEIKKEIKQKINYTERNILFAIGSDRLSIISYKALDQLSLLLITHPDLHLTIDGYTDNTGTPEFNLILSKQRADAVKKYLVSKGVGGDHITTHGFGEQRPIADNNTMDGKERNRRVELKATTQ
jgi:OmpA-OmpF porin, OOP family